MDGWQVGLKKPTLRPSYSLFMSCRAMSLRPYQGERDQWSVIIDRRATCLQRLRPGLLNLETRKYSNKYNNKIIFKGAPPPECLGAGLPR